MWTCTEWGFTLPKQATEIDECDVAGSYYADLPDGLRIRFDTYALDVVLVEDADEDEVREMFLRLQNGTSLRAQEKRNFVPRRCPVVLTFFSSSSFLIGSLRSLLDRPRAAPMSVTLPPGVILT